MKMDVSVIVCTFNRCENLRHAIKSLLGMENLTDLSWELLIVDNNSTDRTRSVVESLISENVGRIRYHFEPQQGKSHALNRGIQAATGKILAFTDDDITVDPLWLSNLKEIIDLYDCTGVGGRIIPVFRAKVPTWLRLDTPRPFLNALVAFDFGGVPGVLECPPFGANMAFKREVFERYGMFRTDLGPKPYNPLGKGEDSEFASRLQEAGEALMYAPDAVVYHPVEKERMKKRYFESWYFNLGRSMIMRSLQSPDHTVYMFGVPRYLYRRLLTTLATWLVTVDAHSRYCNKLHLYQALGEITESLYNKLAVSGKV